MEREAELELRYATVTLLPPKRLPSACAMTLQLLELQVVEVRKVNAPVDLKEPVQWILATTLTGIESLCTPIEILETCQIYAD